MNSSPQKSYNPSKNSIASLAQADFASPRTVHDLVSHDLVSIKSR